MFGQVTSCAVPGSWVAGIRPRLADRVNPDGVPAASARVTYCRAYAGPVSYRISVVKLGGGGAGGRVVVLRVVDGGGGAGIDELDAAVEVACSGVVAVLSGALVAGGATWAGWPGCTCVKLPRIWLLLPWSPHPM